MKPPLERNPTKKRHSWWWDSHLSPKNSKWLAENLEEMDKQVKEMLQLIEEDGDSFAKKAQMYYQRRPMLVSHVESFYRMYRALAERYDNVTGELRKNIPSGMQSQGSLTGSEGGSEGPGSPSPSPEPQKARAREPSPRAAGFDVFLSNKNGSPASRKEAGELASQSESDAKSDDGEDDGIAYTLHQRVLELEDELNTANEMLRDADRKLEALEQKALRSQCGDHKENGSTSEEISRLSERNAALEAEISSLKEEMAAARKQHQEEVSERNADIIRYKQELAGASEAPATNAEIDSLKEQMASARKQLEEELSRRDLEISRCRDELADQQQIIDNVTIQLEKASEAKSSLEQLVQELKSAADAEAEKHKQEAANASARLSEETAALQKAIEGMKSEQESFSQQKSSLESWFAELEQVVGRGRRICRE